MGQDSPSTRIGLRYPLSGSLGPRDDVQVLVLRARYWHRLPGQYFMDVLEAFLRVNHEFSGGSAAISTSRSYSQMRIPDLDLQLKPLSVAAKSLEHL